MKGPGTAGLFLWGLATASGKPAQRPWAMDSQHAKGSGDLPKSYSEKAAIMLKKPQQTTLFAC